jgi:membrane protein required for beta-lactamase induction
MAVAPAKEINMAEHQHGKMDISVQEKTFENFVSMVTKATIVIIVFLVLLALINA